MSGRQIILTQLILLVGMQPALAQPFVPPSQPPATTPYPATGTAPPVVVPAPPYLQPSSMPIQQAPQFAPVFPPQSTVVPLPSHAPGSIFAPSQQAAPSASGDVQVVPANPDVFPQPPLMPGVPGATPQPVVAVPGIANPVAVPVVDEELAWDQIVDVVSDYFTVAREHRARRGGEVWSEGRIETVYQSGATWLEPHRHDSVGSFNRWESTFQTIRRRAVVRVIPDTAGFLVEVVVEKELEDLPNPEKSTAGAATFRADGSLPSRRLEEVSRTRSSPRWIQLGRDPALEQRILAEIHARLSGVTTASGAMFGR